MSQEKIINKIHKLSEVEASLMAITSEYGNADDSEIVAQRLGIQDSIKKIKKELKAKLGEMLLND